MRQLRKEKTGSSEKYEQRPFQKNEACVRKKWKEIWRYSIKLAWLSSFVKLLLLSVGSLAILFTGCLGTFGGVSTLDLIEHSENYLGQSVTIVGMPSASYFCDSGFTSNQIKYCITARNEEGRIVGVLVKYDYFYCLNCELTGVVRKVSVCGCYDTNLGGSGETRIGIGKTTVVACQQAAQENPSRKFECDSINEIYYLDVTKVKTRDN
jgi:hypothetical protein